MSLWFNSIALKTGSKLFNNADRSFNHVGQSTYFLLAERLNITSLSDFWLIALLSIIMLLVGVGLGMGLAWILRMRAIAATLTSTDLLISPNLSPSPSSNSHTHPACTVESADQSPTTLFASPAVVSASQNIPPYCPIDQTPEALLLQAQEESDLLEHTPGLTNLYIENIINSMVDSLIVMSPRRIITKVNQATLDLLGYNAHELLRKPVDIIFTEETGFELTSLIQKNFVGTFETTYISKDGRRIPVRFSGAFIHDQNGAIQGIVGVAQDIAKSKEFETALQLSEAKNRAFVSAIPDGMFRINRNGIYLDFKAGSDDDLEVYPENLVGQNIYQVLPVSLAQQWVFHMMQALRTEETQIFEYHLNHQQQQLYYEARIVVSGENEVLAIVRNITERKRAEAQLLHDAFHDVLTGLANRALFMDRLGHVVELANRRDNFLFAVLFLDLDRFKVVNDSLGHMVGDQLLIDLTRRLQSCLRTGDTIARLGGDEFAILLEDIDDTDDAIDVAKRIQAVSAVPFNLNGHEVFTGVSIGITLSITGYDQPDDLLRDADTAMYRAKALGNSSYQVFDQAMHIQAVTLLQIENDLRRAIERQEFEVYYQPIVALGSQKIMGFEALVRWHHPEKGLIMPIDFIPIAEETGLILQIGHLVLRQACRQMQQWQDEFQTSQPLSISVNLSGKQFMQPDLVERVCDVLEETGLAPSCLELEITESVMMDNAVNAANILKQLQSLGIRLSIDDFGTGYSSLAYLHSLPIDTLKIDRSFINSIDSDVEKLEIIQTIVKLAWNLGLDVVAEGIETKKQLAQLKALRCESGQGFLFAKPMTSQDVEKLMSGVLQPPSSS